MPPILKTASVRPLPKQKPAKSVSNDIRPISLTSQVSKVLTSVLEKMDCRQFAVAGRSTEQAIVCLLHLALEALDRGGCAIRFFFADFRKAFDLIDHHILLQKLSKFNIQAALLRVCSCVPTRPNTDNAHR